MLAACRTWQTSYLDHFRRRHPPHSAQHLSKLAEIRPKPIDTTKFAFGFELKWEIRSCGRQLLTGEENVGCQSNDGGQEKPLLQNPIEVYINYL